MIEIHLFIIWSNGLNKKDKILGDLKNKFDILEIYNTTWTSDKFSENLSRFYGENLPKNSNKEKHCGSSTFTCIIVRDNNPTYDFRNTSKGERLVNTGLFDAKQLYRKWTGGGHKIHATDDIVETKFQLALLFGKDYDMYINMEISEYEEFDWNKNLVGSYGWNSFEELFYIMNLTCRYVILRNFYNLDEQLNSKHPDVDLLVESKTLVSNIINAKPTTKKAYRAQYNVLVSKRNINFDLRHIGDNYYCEKWEMLLINDRKKHKYFYIPNEGMYFYSLLYHALVHKNNISSDYIDEFITVSKNLNFKLDKTKCLDINLLNILLRYMLEHDFNIVEPIDLSVRFNNRLISNKIYIEISVKRKIYEYYLRQRKNIKNILIRIKNKVSVKK